jgi:hypothetical protein
LTDQTWERGKDDSQVFGLAHGKMELLVMMRWKNTGEGGLEGILGAVF